MTDAELLENLEAMGIARDSWRAVTLLPLVQVAWADGRVQAPERARILGIAHEHGLLDGPGGALVRGWLEARPSDEVLRRGRSVLVALAHRHSGPAADWGPEALSTIRRQCEQIARSAGGLLDLAFTVEDRERRALQEIEQALSAESEALLDDLPSPPGGRFDDL